MKRKIPNSGLLIVPKTGHTVNLEEPALFNQAVLDFITAVDQNAWTPRLDTTTGLLPPEEVILSTTVPSVRVGLHTPCVIPNRSELASAGRDLMLASTSA